MLGITILSQIALCVSLFSYSTVSSLVSSEFRLSNTESGLLTSAFALAYALMQIPAGILADRFGGGKTLLSALVVLTTAPLIFVTGHTFTAGLLSRVIAGIGAGLSLPSCVRMISSWFSEKELDRAMGALGSGFGSSQIIVYAVLPLLIFDGNWRPPMLFTVLFSLGVTLLAILPARWSVPTQTTRKKERVDVRGLFTRNLFALTLPNFSAILVTVGIFAWAPTFLASRLNLNPVDAGRIIAVTGVMSIIASYTGGLAAQRLGQRVVIVVSMLFLILMPFLMGTTASWLTATLWLSLLALGGAFSFAPVFALIPYAARQGPEVAGVSFGLFNTLGNIGSFISPVMIGYVLDTTGSFSLGFSIIGAVAVLGLLGALLIRIESFKLKPFQR